MPLRVLQLFIHLHLNAIIQQFFHGGLDKMLLPVFYHIYLFQHDVRRRNMYLSKKLFKETICIQEGNF
jgi:hypothetical protein